MVDAVGEGQIRVTLARQADVVGLATLAQVTGARSHAADADVGGQVAAAIALVDDERAEARMNEGGILREAGLQLVGGAAVIAVGAGDGANERDAVHLLGHLREDLADLNAIGAGLDGLELACRGAARLGIPRVNVAHAATVPEEDDGLGLGRVSGANRAEEAVDGHAEQRGRASELAEEPATGGEVISAGAHGF